MKCIILVSVISLLIFSNKMPSGSRADRMDEHEDEHVDNMKEAFPFAMNNFTLTLFQNVVDSSNGGNILLFPLNIAKLLFMVFLGSTGRVAKQIQDALNMNLHASTFHTNIHNIFYELGNSEKKHTYKATDKIYVASSVHLHRQYKILLRMFYPNGLKSVDLPEAVDNINTLINSRTRVRMCSLGSEIDITPDALILLLSFVAFTGEWDAGLQSITGEISSHNEDSIYPNSNFVSASLNYRTDERIHCQMIELPMVIKSTSLLLVLPPRQESFKTLLKTITVDILDSWVNLEGFEKTQVLFEKVKLDLHCDLHLERILPKLGITDLFKNPGGLTKMSFHENLFVNGFIQKSFMQIEASTVTGTGENDQPVSGIILQLNAPYFFFIIDKSNKNIIISAGLVMD